MPVESLLLFDSEPQVLLQQKVRLRSVQILTMAHDGATDGTAACRTVKLIQHISDHGMTICFNSIKLCMCLLLRSFSAHSRCGSIMFASCVVQAGQLWLTCTREVKMQTCKLSESCSCYTLQSWMVNHDKLSENTRCCLRSHYRPKLLCNKHCCL